MSGNTVYLNGLNELNCCLENSNNPTIPVQGLGEVLKMANEVKNLASKGINNVNAKVALTNEVKKAANKIIGNTPITPLVNPSFVNPNQPKPQVVNTAVTEFKKSVIEQKRACATKCAPPVRSLPSIDVKIGATPKKQLRKFNAQELNAMTRVVIEPMRKSLEATLQNLNQYPAQNAVYYNVPVYKQALTEILQNWSNPSALKEIIAKYRGKVMNKPVINKLAMIAGLGGYNGLNGLGDFLSDGMDAIGDAFSNAAKFVANATSNIYDSLKAGVDVTFDMINKAGAAIGEGIKNAAIWTVGMLQKYNPLMIIARQAFRGLLAINFRGWASDMQGMRDRGEGDKIKDTWTGTFVGGDWGDLVSAINTGAGRDMKKAETATVELTPETINTIEPFDWVGGQKDGLGFHTVAKHTLKAGDEISINVLIGDKSYNGVHKVKYIGDDEGKNKDNFFVLNIIKKGGASGTFQFADEFARMNDLWNVGINPDTVQKGAIDLIAGQEKEYRYTGSDLKNGSGQTIITNNTIVKGVIGTQNITTQTTGQVIGQAIGILYKSPYGNRILKKEDLVDTSIFTVPANQIPDITKLNQPSTEYTTSIVNGRVVRTPIVKNAPTPVVTPIVTKPVVTVPVIKPIVTAPVTAPVTTKVVGKSTIKFNIAPPTQSKQGVMKGLGSLGAEPVVTTASMLAVATPIITVVTAVITGKAPENTGNKKLDDAAAEFNRLKKIKEDAERALQQGKDFVNQFNPSGGGSNNNGSTPSTPNTPATPNNPFTPSTPSTPATPNGGNNNANSGGAEAKGNNNIILIGGAIAAVLVIALMANNSNATPAKQNLNGLDAAKTASKAKTLNNFKL